jgi:pimeloyl-ACP methyl ester carboxylesterase
MIPFNFGADSRKLFGILSSRSASMPPKIGVVLCNAFGRESIRAHRLYRVLAERLSRAGCDVLRFDYYATGDSAGEDREVDLDGFSADLLVAHAELKRRATVPAIVWVGMRLGAAVVQLAARAAPADLARVVLWDPIGDGRDYLDLLRARHLELLSADEEPIGEVTPVFRDRPDLYIDEAIGFPIPRAFCDQLRQFRFAIAGNGAHQTHVLCDPGTVEGRALAATCGRDAARVALVEIAHGTDWTSEADATGLVPAPVINLLIERIGGSR